jgi:hypothetical protein
MLVMIVDAKTRIVEVELKIQILANVIARDYRHVKTMDIEIPIINVNVFVVRDIPEMFVNLLMLEKHVKACHAILWVVKY